MSGAYCAVPGCGNKQYKTNHTNPDIKYYYFPKTDSPRRKRWLKFCNKPHKFKGYICSVHFREEDFRLANVIDDPNFKRRLLPNAVPSIRPNNYENHVKEHIGDDDDEVEEIGGVNIEDDDDLSSSLVERLSTADMEHSNQLPQEDEEEDEEENQEIEEDDVDHASLLTPQTELKDYLMDNDGFRVEFDPEIPGDERKFYMRKYPTVNAVRERRVHCTVCCEHIGTAPAQESNIRMHPILKVTHCGKCHDFYNSGEFSKGEDGSELYCRWCGQGGQVYCCAKCPYVFCYSCITNNLGKDCVRDIEENENWNCFACAPKIMWHLRSQHWALMNFIEKQKQSILSENASDSDIKRLMTKDMTTCCKHIKRPNSTTSGRASEGSASDSELSLSEIRKRALSSTPNLNNSMPVKKILPKPVTAEKRPMPKLIEAPTAKKAKLANNDEVVCTPDVLSMLQNANQGNNVQKTHVVRAVPALQPQPQLQQRQIMSGQRQAAPQTIQPQILTVQSGGTAANIQSNNQQPPPLIIRNFNTPIRAVSSSVVARKTIVGARPPSTAPGQSPVYHTINGFRIDLNSAAQQETFRLPNGKLIQVKKQGFANGGQANSNQNNVVANTTGHVTIHNPRPALNQRQMPTITPQVNVQAGVQHFSIAQPTLATIRYATATSQGLTGTTTITTPSGTVIGQLLNGNAATVQAQLTSRPTPIPTLVRQFFSATPLGQARTQLQNQIFSAMDICQHLTTKIHTLTNSNAYKSVSSYTDVKELYIHLSYLFTYAIGRFKTLQEKCLDDMRRLGFAGDAASLESGQMGGEKPTNNSDADDDDIEIVEPKTTLIDLDSDEEEATAKTTEAPALVVVDAASITNQFLNSALPNGDEHSPVTPTTPTPSITPAEGDSSMQGSYSETGSPESNNASRQNSVQDGNSVREPKKPRTKITHTPNPHLLKKQEMQQREKEKEQQRKIPDPKTKSDDASRVENENASKKSPQQENSKGENEEKGNSFEKTPRIKVEGGEEVQEVLKVVEEDLSSVHEDETPTETAGIKVKKNNATEKTSEDTLHEESSVDAPEKSLVPPSKEVEKEATLTVSQVQGVADIEHSSAEATSKDVIPTSTSVNSVAKGAFESVTKDKLQTEEIVDKVEEVEDEEEDEEDEEEDEEEDCTEPDNAEQNIPNNVNPDEIDESSSADIIENGDPVEYSEKGDDTMDDDNTETNLDNEENSGKSRRISLESVSCTTETSQDRSQHSQEPYNSPQNTNGNQASFSALKKLEPEEDSNSKFDEEMDVDDEVIESSVIEAKDGEQLKIPHRPGQEAASKQLVTVAVNNEANLN